MKDFIRQGETAMKGVREYGEGMPVRLAQTMGLYVAKGAPRDGAGRIVIVAYNEGGYSCTEVDLLDVIAWVKQNRPELLA